MSTHATGKGPAMNNYQGKVMLRVLICSHHDLRPDLSQTLVGRQGIEVYRVEKFADVRLVASSLGVQVIFVDRDFPEAADFIRRMRREPGTRDRSIAVLRSGPRRYSDHDLLSAGANAIFRIPPDEGWDERFSKLLTVPVRRRARLSVDIKLPMDLGQPAAVVDLSPGGMLLATQLPLHVGDEFKFRLPLPDGTVVIGRGRVARMAQPTGFGVEFVEFDEDEGRSAVQGFLKSVQRH